MDMLIHIQKCAAFALRKRAEATTAEAKLAFAEIEIAHLRDLLKRAGIKPYQVEAEPPVPEAVEVNVTANGSAAEEFVAV
jgi:deoxyribodipyrimidine photolyase